MLQAILLFITGLTLSGVAIYYSVAGLGAIFAGAVVPIYIMGTSLELAKLVAASWLKANWYRAPWFLRLYMFIAIAGLMAITSIGVFGYLSKAHIEQSSSASGLEEKVAIIDSRIASEQAVINQYRTDLTVLNDQISKFSELGSVSKGVAARESQQAERNRILEKIDQSQSKVSSLQQEKEPIALQLRSVEAEVGPIKYIAAFVYGDHPDASTLEKSVTWLIILIVVIFDPLAIALLLAAQLTLSWSKETKSRLPSEVETSIEPDSYKIAVPDETDTVNKEPDKIQSDIIEEEQPAIEMAESLEEVSNDLVSESGTLDSEATRQEESEQEVSQVNNSNNLDIISEEAKRYIVDESKKKTYMMKEANGQTAVRIKE